MFDFSHRQFRDRVLHLLEEQLSTLRQIEHLLRTRLPVPPPPVRTSQIAIQFEGANNMNTVSMTIGQSVTASIVALEADGTTATPGAVVSAQTWSVPDATVVVLTTNPDGTAGFKAVAAGTATVSAAATVTDADGTVAPFTQTGTITVTAPTARTAGIGISFGTPA